MSKYNYNNIILCLFLFSIPISESVKNITWFLYIISWIFYNQYRFNNNDIFSKNNLFHNLLYFALILSPLFVAFFCQTDMDEWDGAWDVVRYGLFGWFISHSKLTLRFTYSLLLIAVVSTLFACAHGLMTRYGSDIELNSVGHVNHSAIYLGQVLGITYCLIISSTINRKYHRGFLFLTFLFLLFVFSEMSARGAFIPFILFFLLYPTAIFKKNIKLFTKLIICLTLLFSLIFILDLGILQKFNSKSTGYRVEIFNTSFLIFKTHPLWGIGLENSKFFYLHDVVKNICDTNNLKFIPEKLFFGGVHAHNLYMQSLVERGILGTIPLILFLTYCVKIIFTTFRKYIKKPLFVIYGSSICALMMVLLGGIFNTTFHHEHGLLSIFLISLSCRYFLHFKSLNEIKSRLR